MRTTHLYIIAAMLFAAGCASDPSVEVEAAKRPPNILLAIADDAGHMGRSVAWVDTPSIDQVADAGIRFLNAYTPNAKCAPSRASLITGRNSWQLKEGANHWNNFPAEFKTYPEALRDLGYATGYTGKGWSPGNAGMVDGKPRELTGPRWRMKHEPPTKAMSKVDYAESFIAFYKNKKAGQPFHFWYGAYEPHRPYTFGSSLKAGKTLGDIDKVPGYFPDNEIVRTDLLDYALEIEHFDTHLGRILDFLERQGELDNTLVIVTSDHGMPFPRAKGEEYEASNHVPLVMMWGDQIKRPGRVIEEYVSFVDIAPTLFDIAGFTWRETGMQSSPGSSLADLFEDQIKDHTTEQRDHVLIGKERHGVGRPGNYGYPIRGIVKDGWLYLRNYRPDLWPAGNPETGYSTVGGSPTKTQILRARHNPATKHFWDLSFGKRPEEELYRIAEDPDCLNNLAANPTFADLKEGLRGTMEAELRAQKDPRMFGQGDLFHTYPFLFKSMSNYYERRIKQGEDLVPPWINASDIETDLMEENP